eukprot:Protomagalhaensia_sp_Gyna_25__1761@NODE_1927_length_1412_cov_5_412964_g1586_i0_p1_GENE_NODE_1927_length_1412_cov_5_412964_g1586_i0NODE_1927_length_1412_cov_5_412964_g1586_i0_p1_ORF_typecomplete_len257_score33_95DUF349/PF03993_12/0_0079_NODE_1927_length_1412_cov_5_412964_g1586_i0146916
MAAAIESGSTLNQSSKCQGLDPTGDGPDAGPVEIPAYNGTQKRFGSSRADALEDDLKILRSLNGADAISFLQRLYDAAEQELEQERVKSSETRTELCDTAREVLDSHEYPSTWSQFKKDKDFGRIRKQFPRHGSVCRSARDQWKLSYQALVHRDETSQRLKGDRIKNAIGLFPDQLRLTVKWGLVKDARCALESLEKGQALPKGQRKAIKRWIREGCPRYGRSYQVVSGMRNVPEIQRVAMDMNKLDSLFRQQRLI